MALWYHTGNGWARHTLAYRDHNCAAFLCCGGPSLKKIDPSKLNGPNRIVFGVNNVYPFIRPDYWIGMDDPKCYHRDIFNQPFPKIMRGGYQNRVIEDGLIYKNYNMFYADCKNTKEFDDTFTKRSHDTTFIWHWSTIATALHIVVWMGCKDIYLFGNDLSNAKSDYFSSEKLSKNNRDYNTKFYSQVYKYLKKFAERGRDFGVNLYSCSEGSKAHDFLEYYDYNSVISKLERSVLRDKELLHSKDAEAQWKALDEKSNNKKLGNGPQI